jgi:ankyrin repeat protein
MKCFIRYLSQAVVLVMIVSNCLSVQAAGSDELLRELLRAAELGDAKGVDQMISKGLDPNTADAKGNTLLMIATREGHRDVVSTLVRRKANANRRNQYGDTALMLATLRGDREIARMLIEFGGAEVKHSGWAPIHYAAFYDKPEMIRYLIAKGADKDALAPNGYTPLMLSARSGHTDAARALLQEDVDINVRSPDGQTALKIARQKKHGEVAELIARAGGVE